MAKSNKLVIASLLIIFSSLVVISFKEGKRNEPEFSDAKVEVVRSKAPEIMPFDLNKSKHYFSKTKEGGVEEVSALNLNDEETINLVRGHFKDIMDEFRLGNYERVKFLHGAEMPGIKILETKYTNVTISYIETESGAKLVFTTKDTEVLEAIHLWFDAQVAEHGDDALMLDSFELSKESKMSEEVMCKHHPETCVKP